MSKKKQLTSKQFIKQCIQQERIVKTYKGDFYTINSLLGNDWARFFYLLGGREAGKSYAAMRWATNRKLKNPDKVKFYWFRLTETQQKSLLTNGAGDLIDPDLKRKYNLKTTTKGNIVYTYQEETTVNRNGKETTKKVNLQEFCRVMACSTFYNDKGRGYFDNEYDGEYIIILDEMNREQNEKNSFDIVYAFVNQLENVVRSTPVNVRVILIGNTLEEASDLLSALNFIPDGWGRFKLVKNRQTLYKFMNEYKAAKTPYERIQITKKYEDEDFGKRAVVDYIKPNENYKARRKNALANALMGDASTFTNEIEIDRSLLVNKRKRHTPYQIIKFNKSRDTWFTLWNNNIITDYNNEQVPTKIAMRRYLDEIYNQDAANIVIEMFDARAFKFTTLATFKKFQKQMRLLKPQK